MKKIINLLRRIQHIFQSWIDKFDTYRLKKKYPDFQHKDEFDCGKCKFIWGIKSPFDLTQSPPCLYTLNDMDLTYSRDNGKYILGVETAIWFGCKRDEVEYFDKLLKSFTQYMTINKLPMDEPYKFWMSNPDMLFEGDTIPEVYTGFKIFVEGYKALYNNERIVNNDSKVQEN